MQRRAVMITAAALASILISIVVIFVVFAQRGAQPVIGGSGHQPGTPHALSTEVLPTSCGDWGNPSVAGTAAFEIAQLYGEVRGCGLLAGTWLIITLGKIEASGARDSGVFALYPCNADQAACLNNQNDHPFAGWTFVSPPFPGEIRILQELDDHTLQFGVGNSQEAHTFDFDVATRTFVEVGRPLTPTSVEVTPSTPTPLGGTPPTPTPKAAPTST